MPESSIDFLTQTSIDKLSNKRKLRAFIKHIFKSERKNLKGLNIIFCSDKYLLKINQRYLLHNFYTDIITFNLSDSKEIVGEIYISIDRIRANSNLFGIKKEQELLRVIFHGILHLCGYKDNTKKGKLKMTLKENSYLYKWNTL